MTIPEKHTISNYTIPEQLLTYNITLVVQEMVVGSILPDSHVYRKELINSISLLVIRNLNIKQCLCVCVFSYVKCLPCLLNMIEKGHFLVE